jgi:hypothetical protein
VLDQERHDIRARSEDVRYELSLLSGDEQADEFAEVAGKYGVELLFFGISGLHFDEAEKSIQKDVFIVGIFILLFGLRLSDKS